MEEEEENPGPLNMKQQKKRFSEPSHSFAPPTRVWSMVRQQRSYPLLGKLEDELGREESGERVDRVAAAVEWVDKELRKVSELQTWHGGSLQASNSVMAFESLKH